MIVLDSDVLIHIIDQKSSKGEQALTTLEQNEDKQIVISSIALQEVSFGLLKQANISKIHHLLQIPVIDFNKEIAIKAAELEVEMERQGMKKPRGDILIAATAVHLQALLFTFNTSHFKDVPDLLLLENK